MVILDLGADKRHDLKAHFLAAEEVAGTISKTFRAPNELEFEKIYYPYVLYAKKRYAGAMYTNPDKMDKVDVKGLSLVRRDNAPIVRDISKSALDAIILRRDPDEALGICRDEIAKVLRGQQDLNKFVISKTLKTTYKNDNQPHVHVAKKILSRTGTAVTSGTRVPYVFVKGRPDLPLSQRAEDPEFVVASDLEIDALFYIDHQITNPLISMLDVVCPDPHKAIFDVEPVRSLLKRAREVHAEKLQEAKRIKKNKTNNQSEITAFFAK